MSAQNVGRTRRGGGGEEEKVGGPTYKKMIPISLDDGVPGICTIGEPTVLYSTVQRRSSTHVDSKEDKVSCEMFRGTWLDWKLRATGGGDVGWAPSGDWLIYVDSPLYIFHYFIFAHSTKTTGARNRDWGGMSWGDMK